MSMQCHKVVSLEIFAKLLTSDSSVVSTKNFILCTRCLAALSLCQQVKYCAVKKIFLVFHFSQDFATFVFIQVSAWDIFAVGQNLILSPILFAKCYLTETFLAVQGPRFISSGEIYSRTIDILPIFFTHIWNTYMYTYVFPTIFAGQDS